MPGINGIHHLALSVTDLDRSLDWYCDLFGLIEFVRDRADGVTYAILGDERSGLAIGLRQFDATPPGASFTHLNPGMDHVAFQVSDRAELDDWQSELAARSIDHSPRCGPGNRGVTKPVSGS